MSAEPSTSTRLLPTGPNINYIPIPIANNVRRASTKIWNPHKGSGRGAELAFVWKKFGSAT